MEPLGADSVNNRVLDVPAIISTLARNPAEQVWWDDFMSVWCGMVRNHAVNLLANGTLQLSMVRAGTARFQLDRDLLPLEPATACEPMPRCRLASLVGLQCHQVNEYLQQVVSLILAQGNCLLDGVGYVSARNGGEGYDLLLVTDYFD